jgi:hypothetical protein
VADELEPIPAFRSCRHFITTSFRETGVIALTHTLHRYLTEFEYRFNARRDAAIFENTVSEMLQTKPMPMKQLIAGV